MSSFGLSAYLVSFP